MFDNAPSGRRGARRGVLLGAAVPLVLAVGGLGASASSAAPSASPLAPGQHLPTTPITPETNTRAAPDHAGVPQNGASIATATYDVATFGFDQARTGKNTAES